ncbi:MAG: hypothetical protein PHQ30_05220 [Candidatus Izemoplasmatales bacterium]|nr:hypothetical protein [Candidatus Izemoplasmatales bacterium]
MMSTDNRQLISFQVDGRLPKDAYARLDAFNYQLMQGRIYVPISRILLCKCNKPTVVPLDVYNRLKK